MVVNLKYYSFTSEYIYIYIGLFPFRVISITRKKKTFIIQGLKLTIMNLFRI